MSAVPGCLSTPNMQKIGIYVKKKAETSGQFVEGEEEIWQCDSTFWSTTVQPLVADEATMQYLKGDMYSFIMRHKSLICQQRLQSGRPK